MRRGAEERYRAREVRPEDESVELYNSMEDGTDAIVRRRPSGVQRGRWRMPTREVSQCNGQLDDLLDD